MSEKYITVCPNCGSTDVRLERMNIANRLGLDTEFVCNNCGFTSKIFPELPIDKLEKYEKKLKEMDPDRYLQKRYPEALKKVNRKRLIAGAIFTLFGMSAIPGIGATYLAPLALIIAGIAIIYYELHKK